MPQNTAGPGREFYFALSAYFLVLGVLIGVLLSSNGGVGAPASGSPQTGESGSAMSTYLGFVAVMLTAVTVVLATLAIGVGFFAIYTRREIKDAAQRMAKDTLSAELDERLSDQVIKDRIDAVAFRMSEAATGVNELEEGFDRDDTGER